MIKKLIYEKETETIRQIPENYLIAAWKGRWICDPDMAADKELSTSVFLALFDYEARYDRNISSNWIYGERCNHER